jgi:ribosomal-protein-alanine N-acetyltransferase
MPSPFLRTSRLVLRPWRDDDLEPLAAMSADPEVMRHFPSVLDRDASAALLARLRAHFDEHGFGFWAAETEAGFVGCIGLLRVTFVAPFSPCVEVGWRLARHVWGLGLATEGAAAALRFGFDVLGEREIVSFAVPANRASQRVMERLGMRRDPDGDFDHPHLAADSPLRRHVLYRLQNEHFGR